MHIPNGLALRLIADVNGVVVNLVLLEDGSIWSCDVGFGGDGPTSPLQLLPLPAGQEPHVTNNLGAQAVRLRKGQLPDTLRKEANQVWFYEYRNGKDADWNTYYAFSEMEASAWDLECANWWVASHPESFQRKQILVVKFLRSRGTQAQNANSGKDAEVEGKVVGKIMLADGVLKRNMGGKTEVVKICRTEEERVQVLEEHFGIYLTDKERQGIQGFETQLKG